MLKGDDTIDREDFLAQRLRAGHPVVPASMESNMAMAITRERELAAAVMRVASRRPDGIATYAILYAEIPDEIALTKADWEPSPMRSDEPTWHQNIRNIQLHDEAEDNPIAEGWLVYVPRGGYQITDAGRRHIS